MSKPTPEQIAAALRCCSGSNRELLCIDCAFLDGIYCLENDGFDMAADLILAQAARIRELEAQVDAVEVVRCRDCRFSHLTNDGVREYCDYCDYYENGVIAVCFELDHFCSHGKRREVQYEAD